MSGHLLIRLGDTDPQVLGGNWQCMVHLIRLRSCRVHADTTLPPFPIPKWFIVVVESEVVHII